MKKLLNSLKEREITFTKLFIIFLIGSIVGNYYEMILSFISHLFKDGSLYWKTRQGLIYGPFCPIYGFGAVIMTIALANKDYKWYKIVIYAALMGGIFEFAAGWFQEKILGTVSWDYSEYPLDIDGKTSLPIMLLWGMATLLYIKVIYPYISRFVNKIPPTIGAYVIDTLIIFIAFDSFISFSAVLRQNLRHEGYPPYTIIGEICDRIYTDKKLDKVFPTTKEE